MGEKWDSIIRDVVHAGRCERLPKHIESKCIRTRQKVRERLGLGGSGDVGVIEVYHYKRILFVSAHTGLLCLQYGLGYRFGTALNEEPREVQVTAF